VLRKTSVGPVGCRFDENVGRLVRMEIIYGTCHRSKGTREGAKGTVTVAPSGERRLAVKQLIKLI
jgi:hypothetical protein